MSHLRHRNGARIQGRWCEPVSVLFLSDRNQNRAANTPSRDEQQVKRRLKVYDAWVATAETQNATQFAQAS